jgi:hypothetical protein
VRREGGALSKGSLVSRQSSSSKERRKAVERLQKLRKSQEGYGGEERKRSRTEAYVFFCP